MPRKADIALVTANYGRCDDLFPQVQQDIEVDWIYHTDDPALNPGGWKVVYQHPNGVHPNLAAKRFKLLPPVPHRYVVWVDANIRIESRSFVREALTFINDGIAVHTHPLRDCIYQESLESILTPKYDALPIADQVRHYQREDQFPFHGGLYACGVIAWDRQHPKAEALGKAWLEECERWGFQDQLSFPVVCRRLGIEPGTFPHEQYRSPWFRVHKHKPR